MIEFLGWKRPSACKSWEAWLCADYVEYGAVIRRRAGLEWKEIILR